MATGRFAKAICARCGFKVPYSSLMRDGYHRGLWVCPKCYDEPEPKEPRIKENISLKHPQVDSGADNEVPATLASAFGVSNYFGGGT